MLSSQEINHLISALSAMIAAIAAIIAAIFAHRAERAAVAASKRATLLASRVGRGTFLIY
jgi:hypothetical protein